MSSPDPFTPDSPLVSRIAPSPNVGERRGGALADTLILHYTGMPSCEEAIRWLASPASGVSCHYVVDTDGAITQMAPEAARAWHAGASHWMGVDDINSCSIGIEIHNPGHDLGYPDFPGSQMAAVEALCLDIIGRRRIAPRRVLGHSDVAPRRKIDPGEKFDWAGLALAGVGHWIAPAGISGGAALELGDSGDRALDLQKKLRAYGYGIDATGVFDEGAQIAIAAFQRHFRPALVDGRADRSTVETLDALLDALGGA
ncbi:MAG: N-acetylmuramoyl-L-alanine amidase [Rhodomicrobium sp.]|jgi:N-acetylmuramoyl-L-alanine amidase